MPADSSNPSRPRTRHDFEIAVICALPLEADAVAAVFERQWDSRTYGKATGDTNTYSTGVIGHHNVVLVHLPNMGKVAAATAAAFLRTSYERIKLALLVGICGGVPFGNSSNADIHLGDVVISDGIIQYDLGRRFPHAFVRRNHVRDNLPRPGPLARTFLAMLRAQETRAWLQEQTLENANALRQRPAYTAIQPSPADDRLFKAKYRHKHHEPSDCLTCGSGATDVCEAALKLSCEELGCDERESVFRVRSTTTSITPIIHFGLVASGDSVMKSGEDRDLVASQEDVIAFEMEGAGVWDTFIDCLIIKSVCDYADSHKSKKWQTHAATTAAAATKAILEKWNTANADFARLPFSSHHDPKATSAVLLDPARRMAILKVLNTSPYKERKERNPERVLGTCEWFVAHESFRQWREYKSSSMLWVSADPGCGKSVLMKYLVDDVLRTTESTTVCYFFFKDDFADQRSASSALCCILYQLFHHREIVLSSKIAERFETNGEHITSSFVELWDILLTASRDENAGEIVCVLDAFDECEDQGQSEFTRYLTKLYSTGNNFNLKFLLTSRPYGNIRRGFQPLDIPELPVIHLSGESETEMIKIVQEIDIYIKVRVHNIGERLRLKADEEALLLREILRIPNRTYLWASLTLNIVEYDVKIVDTGIIEVTSRLPRSVDEAYERILSKSTDVEEARKLLQIVIAAARPLTLYEMNLALALRESHRSHEGLNLASEERFSEYVRDICGLFVTVIDSRLYLLHQTAREFLIQTSSVSPRKSYRNRFKWKSLLRIDKSHGLLSRICIWYLLLVEFNHTSLDAQDPNGNTSGYWQRHYKFLNYSAMNWAPHFRKSHVDDRALTESLKEICDVGSMRCKLWFPIYWEITHGEPPPYFTTIMIASYFGLGQLVKLLLRNGREVRSRDEKYMRTALSWASENGFLDVVNLLTKRHRIRFKDIVRLSFSKPQRGVGIEERDRYGRTPLSYAARQGHTAVARLLVKKGARVDSKDHIGGTPISYALCNENQELSRLLLQEGHTVNSVREILEPLLLSAIRRGDRATVKLILDSNKVNTKQGNTEGGRLLSEAVRSGHGPVVKVLLESTKVNANWGNTDGDALLSEAVRSGNAPVVKALLESTKVSADRDALLFKVVKRDHYNAVKLLLESGKVNPNSKDDYGMTPLAWAAKEGHGSIVELLLEIGKVNPKGRDNNGLTALSWASKNDHDSIAKRLKLAIIDYNKG